MSTDRRGPAFQASLLDAAGCAEAEPGADSVGPTVGALGDQVRRTELGAGAWLDLRPGWIGGADELFTALYRDVPWAGEDRWMYGRLVPVPRLHRYLDAVADLPHPALLRAAACLDEHYAEDPAGQFASADLALYRDGRDTVPWHGDPFTTPEPTASRVALIVLGPARPFLLRPHGGGPTQRRLLGHGDLIVMGGSCQTTFEHAVPRTVRAAGPRIAVQLRTGQLMDGPQWSRRAARTFPASTSTST